MSDRTCCLDGFYDNGDMVVPCERCHGKTVASIDLKILAIKTISEMHDRVIHLESEVERLRTEADEAYVSRDWNATCADRARAELADERAKVARMRELAIEACNVGREVGLHYGERGRLDEIRKEAGGE